MQKAGGKAACVGEPFFFEGVVFSHTWASVTLSQFFWVYKLPDNVDLSKIIFANWCITMRELLLNNSELLVLLPEMAVFWILDFCLL